MDEEEKPENPPEVNVEEDIDWEALAKKDPAKLGARFMEMMERQTKNQARILEAPPRFGAGYDLSFANGDTVHIHFSAGSVEEIEAMAAHIALVFVGWQRFRIPPDQNLPPHEVGSKP